MQNFTLGSSQKRGTPPKFRVFPNSQKRGTPQNLGCSQIPKKEGPPERTKWEGFRQNPKNLTILILFTMHPLINKSMSTETGKAHCGIGPGRTWILARPTGQAGHCADAKTKAVAFSITRWSLNSII